MENCGNILIHCSTDLGVGLYSFGISQMNKTEPYLWGGEAVVLSTGEKYQMFSSLSTGTYRWFVKRIEDNMIVKSDYSQVVCKELAPADEEFEDLRLNKMSTAKGVELAGVIQNEVLQVMFNVLKSQSDYIFVGETEINENLRTELSANTQLNILKVFSNLGVILKGGYAEDVETYGQIELIGKENLDYVISKNNGYFRIIFNPEAHEEIRDFQFFCKVERYKDYRIEDFLRSSENGGFGNDNDNTIDVLPEFILTLQE